MSVTVEPLGRDELDAARAIAVHWPHDQLATVIDEKLFGGAPGDAQPVALGAREGGELVGIAALCRRWLRLLVVAPYARGRGVGSALLSAAESAARDADETRLRTLDQPGNYLSPGIDVRNEDGVAWLAKRGYREVARNRNLLCSTKGNPLVTASRADDLRERCGIVGYRVERLDRSDLPTLLALARAEFSEPWAYELSRAAAFEPCGVHVAWHGDDLVAFGAHDGNNRGLGWFGPGGTLVDHRGNRLGEAIVVACLVDVADAGHDACEVAWIGPEAFYRKAVGVIGTREFVTLERSL